MGEDSAWFCPQKILELYFLRMSLANGMPYLRRKSSWNHPTPGTLPWLALHRRILGGWLNSRSMESPNLENFWDISNGPNLFCSKSSTTSFTKIGYSKYHDVSNIRLKSRMFWASWYPPFFETPICFCLDFFHLIPQSKPVRQKPSAWGDELP